MGVGGHKLRLYNVSDSSVTIVGDSATTNLSYAACTLAFLSGVFTIASSKTFRIDHYTVGGQGTYGLGEATDAGVDEIYTVVELYKIE